MTLAPEAIPPQPALPPPQPDLADTTPQIAHPVEAADEDERAWQEALARAKAQADLAMADTGRVSPIAPAARKEDEDDWEVRIAAANKRAEEDTLPERTGFVPPMLGAQVEQDATAANDDLPADLVTSIHHRRLSAPKAVLTALPVAVADIAPRCEEEDWAQRKADAEAKARTERARKERAMREIRRLQTKPLSRGLGAPPRRRVAAGTEHGSAPVPAPLRITRRATAIEDTCEEAESTRAELPRVTQRFS